jgi:putative transposase
MFCRLVSLVFFLESFASRIVSNTECWTLDTCRLAVFCIFAMIRLLMRSVTISVGEYYHVFNRGAHKQPIFHTDADYARFLFSTLHLQSPANFPQIGRLTKHFVQHSELDSENDIVKEIADNRYVDLVAFCLMSNHFHLLLKESVEGGIARYMQRILNSYTKYYNTKYEHSGHLLQGPYKAVHVGANEQLLHTASYIHRNPLELNKWKSKIELYPWSSFLDYSEESRWGPLLAQEIILEQFLNKAAYADFVSESTAKSVQHSVLDIGNE